MIKATQIISEGQNYLAWARISLSRVHIVYFKIIQSPGQLTQYKIIHCDVCCLIQVRTYDSSYMIQL
jgi:hypothetical protein